MSDEHYAPTTEALVAHVVLRDGTEIDGGEAFDRWLAAHDREVAEKAWDEGFAAGHDAGILDEDRPANPYRTPKETP